MLDLGSDRIALVHDWLIGYAGGGERVLEQMLALCPEARLYTSVDTLAPQQRDFLRGREPITSFAQRLPLVPRHHRSFLPLLMFAMEQLDLSDCELVLSSSVSVARGSSPGLIAAYRLRAFAHALCLGSAAPVPAGSEARSRAARYARAMVAASGALLGSAHRQRHRLLHRDSQFIARRIWKVYDHATVIHPPVDVEGFSLRERKELLL